MSSPVFDVSKAPYHASGNGSADDTAALQSAFNDAQAVDGCVYFPAGVYRITQPLSFRPPHSPGRRNIALRGDGSQPAIDARFELPEAIARRKFVSARFESSSYCFVGEDLRVHAVFRLRRLALE